MYACMYYHRAILHEHMAIMIRLPTKIDGNWEQILMHTTTYNPTHIHHRFDTRAGVYGGSVGRVWILSHEAPAVARYTQ